MVDDVAMNYSHPGLKMREICNFGLKMREICNFGLKMRDICNFGLKMREICNFGKEFGKGIGDIYKGCGRVFRGFEAYLGDWWAFWG